MEHKFRVWNKKENRMLYTSLQEDVYLSLEGEVGSDGRYSDNFEPNKNLIAMQYLGINDINNQEIYKDDIVIGGWSDDRPRLIDDLGWFFYEYHTFIAIEGKLKILGNKWENPELLEKIK